MNAVVLFISVLIVLFLNANAISVDLNGEWTFTRNNESKIFKGRVPGDVYSDLHRLELIPNPLYEDNTIALRWVGRSDWTYSKQFSINSSVLQEPTKVLIFDGIDTIADVYLNGKKILEADNQFIRYISDVTDILKAENILQIKFTSPVNYAQQKADEYTASVGHDVPPVCPPEILHGECHPNFIRKAQYSFSWDWGPSFPTMGLWKGVRLAAFHQPQLDTVSWNTKRTDIAWEVRGTVGFLSAKQSVPIQCLVDLCSTGISTKIAFSPADDSSEACFSLDVPLSKVALWWPAGEGNQTLYNLTVKCEEQELTDEIGFRHIELIESFVNPKIEKIGRNFYFSVNDRPIFLKGSNWIPLSMFLGDDHSKRMEFLLDSAVEVGMNTLRVWGGGVYESEEFYRYANRKGILIWQDLMFACALYPINQEFLDNVKIEVEQQVTRLMKHPSILLFSGNNENEIAIRSQWWAAENYTIDNQVSDYLRLYKDTISPIVMSLDPTRRYLLSSPSNGIETERQGGVSANPGDPRFGDVHFYEEFTNLWKDSAYPTPRCASEYGIQSMPSRRTMLGYLNESSWYYTSRSMSHRQHHAAGVLTNLLAVYSHFPISLQCSRSLSDLHQCPFVSTAEFLNRYIFFSQAHQAIMYKTETEHYRRYRNQLSPDGQGNTMCALYWQLNDVWAAPTWSSIDFDLRWKLVHYEARRFFARIAVVMFSTDSDDLAVTVVNDSPDILNGVTIEIKQLAWTNGFHPLFVEKQTLEIPALSAKDINFGEGRSTIGGFLDYDSDYVYAAKLFDSTGKLLAPESVIIPDKLFEVDFDIMGKVSILEFILINESTYSMTIHATAISPFTWVTVVKDGFVGWFSDNGFTMTSSKRQITLIVRSNVTLTKDDLTVCNLRNCGVDVEF